MATEIERKFLVVGDAWRSAAPVSIRQGYLSSHPNRTIRVRIVNGTAHLTIKGMSKGASRAEFEYQIPIDDAQQLMELCEQPLIVKTRRCIVAEGLVWEVDEFAGENKGLVIAEVELKSEAQEISLPDWVGDEVTHDRRYFNSNLTKQPFNSWD